MRFIQFAAEETFNGKALFAFRFQSLILGFLSLDFRARNLGILLVEPNVSARFARLFGGYRLWHGNRFLRVQTNQSFRKEKQHMNDILSYDFKLGSDLLADELEKEELARHSFFILDQVLEPSKYLMSAQSFNNILERTC